MNFALSLLRPGSLLLAFAFAVPTSAFSSSDRGKIFEVPISLVTTPPYKLCGLVTTKLGGQTKSATGSVAFTGTVLTAAEVTWSPKTGFATKVEFERGRDLSKVLEKKTATYIVLIKKFTTATDDFAKFYSNIAGILFKTLPANGKSLKVKTTKNLLEGTFGHFIVGYNANHGDGRQMFDYFAQFEKESQLIYILSPQTDSSSSSSFSGVASVPVASKGAPVFYESEPGVASTASMVGIMVSTTLVRGFSQREIDLFSGGSSSSSSSTSTP